MNFTLKCGHVVKISPRESWLITIRRPCWACRFAPKAENLNRKDS